MKTVYENSQTVAEAIACIRAGAQAQYLQYTGRRGWKTKSLAVSEDNRYIDVVFENDIVQQYSASNFCNKFGLFPVPVTTDPLDQTGDFIVWCPKGTHNPKVVHKTRRIAEMEASRLAKEHRKCFLVMEAITVAKPVIDVELQRK